MGNFKIKDMDLYYSDFHALKDINLDIHRPRSLHSSVHPAVENPHS